MLNIEKSEHGDIRVSKAVVGRLILSEIAKYKGKVILTNSKGKLLNRFQQLSGADEIDNMEINMGEGGLEIRVFVLVRFGTSISRTTNELISGITESVRRVLGIEPAGVSVVVSGVSLGRDKPKKDIEIKE